MTGDNSKAIDAITRGLQSHPSGVSAHVPAQVVTAANVGGESGAKSPHTQRISDGLKLEPVPLGDVAPAVGLVLDMSAIDALKAETMSASAELSELLDVHERSVESKAAQIRASVDSLTTLPKENRDLAFQTQLAQAVRDIIANSDADRTQKLGALLKLDRKLDQARFMLVDQSGNPNPVQHLAAHKMTDTAGRRERAEAAMLVQNAQAVEIIGLTKNALACYDSVLGAALISRISALPRSERDFLAGQGVTVSRIAESLMGERVRVSLRLIDEAKLAVRTAIGRNRVFSQGQSRRTSQDKIARGLHQQQLNKSA